MRDNDNGFGVIFDMDGVLVDSAEPHFRSWQLLVEENGGSVTREQFSSTFGRQNDDIVPILFGEVGSARCRRLADRKEELYRELVREETPIVDGAVDLVTSLYDLGYRLGVGSSGPPPNIELVLGAMGVRDRISIIISGNDVTRGKPDPQVFSLAAGGLGLSPSACVVIEDAPVGIEAAKAAGAKALAVLIHHPAEAFAHADGIVERLTDLTAEKIATLVA